MAVDLKTLTQDEAVKLALEIERTEAALKQMKARLKEYVDANGPLQAGDKVWDYYPAISWEFEPDKLKELAMAIAIDGKNPWEFLSLPASSIKALGMTEAILSTYGTKKENKRFDSRKA